MMRREGPSPAPGAVPVLTEVITPMPDGRFALAATPSVDLLGGLVDVAALEQRLVDEISLGLRKTLESRVHASVAPAISLLADRIAYKAAQEVSAELMDRMQEDLQAAVRQALAQALRRQG